MPKARNPPVQGAERAAVVFFLIYRRLGVSSYPKLTITIQQKPKTPGKHHKRAFHAKYLFLLNQLRKKKFLEKHQHP